MRTRDVCAEIVEFVVLGISNVGNGDLRAGDAKKLNCLYILEICKCDVITKKRELGTGNLGAYRPELIFESLTFEPEPQVFHDIPL